MEYNIIGFDRLNHHTVDYVKHGVKYVVTYIYSKEDSTFENRLVFSNYNVLVDDRSFLYQDTKEFRNALSETEFVISDIDMYRLIQMEIDANDTFGIRFESDTDGCIAIPEDYESTRSHSNGLVLPSFNYETLSFTTMGDLTMGDLTGAIQDSVFLSQMEEIQRSINNFLNPINMSIVYDNRVGNSFFEQQNRSNFDRFLVNNYGFYVRPCNPGMILADCNPNNAAMKDTDTDDSENFGLVDRSEHIHIQHKIDMGLIKSSGKSVSVEEAIDRLDAYTESESGEDIVDKIDIALELNSNDVIESDTSNQQSNTFTVRGLDSEGNEASDSIEIPLIEE